MIIPLMAILFTVEQAVPPYHILSIAVKLQSAYDKDKSAGIGDREQIDKLSKFYRDLSKRSFNHIDLDKSYGTVRQYRYTLFVVDDKTVPKLRDEISNYLYLQMHMRRTNKLKEEVKKLMAI